MKNITEKNVQNRLKRIEGQVRGVSSMIDKKTYYLDITTQISAIKSALISVENILIENHLKKHLGVKFDEKTQNEIMKIFNKRK